MKKLVRASITADDIGRTINLAVLDAANDAFNKTSLGLDDPRNDYFVDNIIHDTEVQRARKALIDALTRAVSRVESY